MLTGIIGSLIATVIWALIAFVYSGKYKTKIKGFFIRVLDVGASNVFSSEQDTEYITDLKCEIEKSNYIRLYSGRGRYLEKEPLRTAYYMENKNFQILLPDIHAKEGVDWIEMGLNNMSYVSTVKESISTSASYIKSLGKGNIELGFYNTISLGKIIITDRVAYFLPYVREKSADKVEICKYSSNTIMYKWLVRYFDTLWTARKN